MQFKGTIVKVISHGEIYVPGDPSSRRAHCTVWAVDADGLGWEYTGEFASRPQPDDVLKGDYEIHLVTDPLLTQLRRGGPHETEHVKIVTWAKDNYSLSVAYRGLADYLESNDIMPDEIISLTLERNGRDWSVRLVIPNRAY